MGGPWACANSGREAARASPGSPSASEGSDDRSGVADVDSSDREAVSEAGPAPGGPRTTARGFPRKRDGSPRRAPPRAGGGVITDDSSESDGSTSSAPEHARRGRSRQASQGLFSSGTEDREDRPCGPGSSSGAKYVLVTKIKQRDSGTDADIVGILHHDAEDGRDPARSGRNVSEAPGDPSTVCGEGAASGALRKVPSRQRSNKRVTFGGDAAEKDERQLRQVSVKRARSPRVSDNGAASADGSSWSDWSTGGVGSAPEEDAGGVPSDIHVSCGLLKRHGICCIDALELVEVSAAQVQRVGVRVIDACPELTTHVERRPADAVVKHPRLAELSVEGKAKEGPLGRSRPRLDARAAGSLPVAAGDWSGCAQESSSPRDGRIHSGARDAAEGGAEVPGVPTKGDGAHPAAGVTRGDWSHGAGLAGKGDELGGAGGVCEGRGEVGDGAGVAAGVDLGGDRYFVVARLATSTVGPFMYTLAVTIPGDPEDPGPGTTIRVHLAGSVMGEGKGTPQLRGNVRLVGHSQQCDSDSTMVE